MQEFFAAAAVAAAVSRPFESIEGAMNTARSDLSRVKSNIQIMTENKSNLCS